MKAETQDLAALKGDIDSVETLLLVLLLHSRYRSWKVLEP